MLGDVHRRVELHGGRFAVAGGVTSSQDINERHSQSVHRWESIILESGAGDRCFSSASVHQHSSLTHDWNDDLFVASD